MPSSFTASLASSVKSSSDDRSDRSQYEDLEKGNTSPNNDSHSVLEGSEGDNNSGLPPSIPDQHLYLIKFDGTDDKWHPRNWSTIKKVIITSAVCFSAFIATYASAAFAPATQQASREFSVSNEIAILGTSLFVLGFAFGPLLWAPWSELSGRRWPMIVGMFGLSIFTVGSAAAKDIQTLIICRFFAGVCGASPLCVVPGVLSDMFGDDTRGSAIVVYALFVFGGPFLAPVVSAFLVVAEGWRWTMWFVAIIGLATTTVLGIVQDESYPAVILVQKARVVRTRTGSWAIHAAHEKAHVEIRDMIQKYFSRPVRMLCSEVMLLLLTVYMSFVYGLVYALLQAYPYIFQSVHGLSIAESNLPFLGLLLGVVLGTLFILYDQRRIIRLRKAEGHLEPEWLLLPPTFCGLVFSASLFWFTWTAYRSDIHWTVPVVAGVLVGFAAFSVFLPCFMFVVEAYLPVAASAVAANVIFRSAFASAFPLFSRQLFETLGVQWAATILACIAAVMAPLPLVFRAYGSRLRRRSKYLVQQQSTP